MKALPEDMDESAIARTPLEADWLAAAHDMLIEGGVSAVQINALAQRLGVTRGGFYWRFRNRQDLLDQLLLSWRNTNHRNFLLALERAGTPMERHRRMVRLLMEERDFNPALDAAVRQWAATDERVREEVRRCDLERIAAIEAIYISAGQEQLEAHVRARVIYFHQIGYYTVNLGDSKRTRQDLVKMYDRILIGDSLDAGCNT